MTQNKRAIRQVDGRSKKLTTLLLLHQFALQVADDISCHNVN